MIYPSIDSDSELFEELVELQNERDLVEEQSQMEPYVLNLRNPRNQEMYVELEDPAPHQVFFYNKAIEETAETLDIEDSELIPDGGRPRKNYWAWFTDNDNLFYREDLNGDEADTLYESIEEAEKALERQADLHPEQEERYKAFSLYKVKRVGKELEGVEVLTEQSGLQDFAPDGGQPLHYDPTLYKIAENAEQLEW